MGLRFRGEHAQQLGNNNTLPVPEDFQRVIGDKPLVIHPSFRDMSVRFFLKEAVNQDVLTELMEETGLNDLRKPPDWDRLLRSGREC